MRTVNPVIGVHLVKQAKSRPLARSYAEDVSVERRCHLSIQRLGGSEQHVRRTQSHRLTCQRELVLGDGRGATCAAQSFEVRCRVASEPLEVTSAAGTR